MLGAARAGEANCPQRKGARLLECASFFLGLLQSRRNMFPRVIPCNLQDLAHAPRSGLPKWGSLVIVSDEHVWFWHGHRLQHALAEALGSLAGSIVVALLPPGEEAKTRLTKERIEDLMLAHRCV